VYILPLLPLLIPLGGMIVAWVLPDKPRFGQPKRWIYTAALGGTFVSFLVLYGTRATDFQYHLWPSARFPIEPLSLAPDALSVALALLFVGILLVISLSMLIRPMERFESVTMMGLVVAGLGTFLAANLLTLAFFWSMMDVILLIMGLVRAPSESVARVTRAILGSVMSAMALLAAVLLITLEGGETNFGNLGLRGDTARLVMVAALLRLGVYPLPGSLQRRWEVLLVSLCTGGYLWLRLGSLAVVPLPGANWLAPLLGWLLIVIGLLAVLARDLISALPLVYGSGIASLVLAGLLGPGAGMPAALLMTVNLSVSLALLLIDAQVRPIPPWGHNARLPLMVGLASAVGWPVTLGFSAHWALFRACWFSGARAITLQASIGYLLVSVPIWQRLRQVLREVRSAGSWPLWQIGIALACASLLGLALLALGVAPALLESLWAGLPSVQGASVSAQSSGSRVAMFIALLATTAVVPFLGSYALQRFWRYGRTSRLAQVGRAVGGVLELDWLYAEIQGLLGRLASLAEYVFMGVEEVFFLGWALIWILVIILYLA
jgi:hypothetical protein